MKRSILISLISLLVTSSYSQVYQYMLNGDINHDNVIDVSDIQALSSMILENRAPQEVIFTADGILCREKQMSPARLLKGDDFCLAIKKLASSFALPYSNAEGIKQIVFCQGSNPYGTLVSDSESKAEARASYNPDNGIVTIHVSSDILELPADCSNMFFRFVDLETIDWGTKETGGKLQLNTSKVTNMFGMFNLCAKLQSIELGIFDTSKVTNMSAMFNQCESLTDLNLSSFNISSVTDISQMFKCCKTLTSLDLTEFETDNVKDMSALFESCTNLTYIKFRKDINTSNVEKMNAMFLNCENLTTIENLPRFITSNVTDMSQMFFHCFSLAQIDLSNFDTRNVTLMWGMFLGCGQVTEFNFPFNFDTSKVTDMSNMFYGCTGLTSLDLTNFNTTSVSDIHGMFKECSNLTTLNLSSFTTNTVENMGEMFFNCHKLSTLDLSNFGTNNVDNMNMMFYQCTKMNDLILGTDFVIANDCNINSMCTNLGNDCAELSITCSSDTKDMLTLLNEEQTPISELNHKKIIWK